MSIDTSIGLSRDFFSRDVLEVAPDLPGKNLMIKDSEGGYWSYMITEVEAYRGTEDLACHASKGRTCRTEVMYKAGGHLYIYLIYGMYWMLNIVTGKTGNPQAVLIRGVEGYNGPGKLTKEVGIDKSWYGIDITSSDIIFVEDPGRDVIVKSAARIGIDYSGEPWKSKPWRYYLTEIR